MVKLESTNYVWPNLFHLSNLLDSVTVFEKYKSKLPLIDNPISIKKASEYSLAALIISEIKTTGESPISF